jgi:hypothetical protein
MNCIANCSNIFHKHPHLVLPTLQSCAWIQLYENKPWQTGTTIRAESDPQYEEPCCRPIYLAESNPTTSNTGGGGRSIGSKMPFQTSIFNKSGDRSWHRHYCWQIHLLTKLVLFAISGLFVHMDVIIMISVFWCFLYVQILKGTECISFPARTPPAGPAILPQNPDFELSTFKMEVDENM